MTDREVMQMALYALEKHVHEYETMEALRACLAQLEPEPVAWRFHDRNMWCYVDHLTDLPQYKFKPLYTEPPKKKWVGLTDDEKLMCLSSDVDQAIANTEAKLKEKNT